MKWIRIKYRLMSQIGSERIVKRFLIIPLTLEYKTRWLEVAEIKQVIVKGKNSYHWKNISYAD